VAFGAVFVEDINQGKIPAKYSVRNTVSRFSIRSLKGSPEARCPITIAHQNIALTGSFVSESQSDTKLNKFRFFFQPLLNACV
jgi:hypothetical protein